MRFSVLKGLIRRFITNIYPKSLKEYCGLKMDINDGHLFALSTPWGSKTRIHKNPYMNVLAYYSMSGNESQSKSH